MADENPYAPPESKSDVPQLEGGATVRVTRTIGFADRFRAYRLLIDGQEMARLKESQSVEIPVSPGTHSIVAKVDWCGSPTLEFNIQNGEAIEFACDSNLRGGRLILVFLYMTIRKDQYLALSQV